MHVVGENSGGGGGVDSAQSRRGSTVTSESRQSSGDYRIP